jgi:REP element-mobilizing transposase RayT
MDKFQNKYRISSVRLQNWDYGWNAAYFITICTANRECYFGNIVDSKMELTEIGELAKKYWQEIPWHFSFVKLDEFIIMPNHTHGIIIINKTDDNKNDKSIKICDVGRKVQTTKLVVCTPQAPRTAAASQKWKPATLGAIINQYKRICTIESRKINPNFTWQP